MELAQLSNVLVAYLVVPHPGSRRECPQPRVGATPSRFQSWKVSSPLRGAICNDRLGLPSWSSGAPSTIEPDRTSRRSDDRDRSYVATHAACISGPSRTPMRPASFASSLVARYSLRWWLQLGRIQANVLRGGCPSVARGGRVSSTTMPAMARNLPEASALSPHSQPACWDGAGRTASAERDRRSWPLTTYSAWIPSRERPSARLVFTEANGGRNQRSEADTLSPCISGQ